MFLHKILLVLFLLQLNGLGIFNGYAAEVDIIAPAYDRPWQIVSYHNQAGMTGLRIFELAFETNGTAWFATSDGLHQYDGYHWTRFGTNDGLPSS